MKITVVVAALLLSVSVAQAQFKSQVDQEPRVMDGVVRPTVPSFLFGWFDPEKFHMSHTFSFSYQTVAGYGLSLGTYTNSMRYEFADNLSARADVSLSYSPFNTIPGLGKKNDLSSVYLSRAQVNYRPWDNTLLQFQYRQIPYGAYYYSPFVSPWYRLEDEQH